MNEYQILLYYKYTNLESPEQVLSWQRMLCEDLKLTGRIIIAKEGINGTVEGTKEATEEYVRHMQADERFKDVDFKRSVGTGNAFPRLSIKIRKEIVSLHLGENDFSPTEVTGKYITAEELHDWIHNSKKEFYIVDMRNDYEHKIGFFKNSILPPLKNFRDLPAVLPKLEHLKDKTVVTVCTGGVRCEKASGFLVKNGFKDVYQLLNGIVTYMEKYPEEDFHGKLYVFDGRITMGFNSPSTPHTVVGTCARCGNASERYVNCSVKTCNAHIICCEACSDNNRVFCSDICSQKALQPA